MVRASKWLICLMAMKLVTMKPVLKKNHRSRRWWGDLSKSCEESSEVALAGFLLRDHGVLCSRVRTDWWGKCCQERRTCLWDQTFVFRNRTQQWPDCQRRDSLRRFFVSYIVAFQHISFMEVKENGIVWIGLVLSFGLIRDSRFFFWESAFPKKRTLYVGCLCETFYCQDPVIPWITIVWYGHILPPNICPSAKYVLSLLLFKKQKTFLSLTKDTHIELRMKNFHYYKNIYRLSQHLFKPQFHHTIFPILQQFDKYV